MIWFDRLRLGLRRRWDRVDATFLDARFVARKNTGSEAGSIFEVWEYMVEVPGAGGAAPVRLSFKEKEFKVRTPRHGDVVPVVVNAKRTKAMFDLSDPRIDADGWTQEQIRQRKEQDEERFAARRAGREVASDKDDEDVLL